MSTDAVIKRQSVDRGSHHRPEPGTLKRIVSSFLSPAAFEPTTKSWTCRYEAAVIDPKSREAARQIARLSAAKKFSDDSENMEKDCAAITSCMSLLQQFSSTPAPIPVASWSSGDGATLFLDQGGFYGDIEVTENSVEYFLKWTEGDQQNEIFQTETVVEGKIPPGLLGHLFAVFARQNA